MDGSHGTASAKLIINPDRNTTQSDEDDQQNLGVAEFSIVQLEINDNPTLAISLDAEDPDGAISDKSIKWTKESEFPGMGWIEIETGDTLSLVSREEGNVIRAEIT